LADIAHDCQAWLDGKLNASAEGEFHKFANKALAALDNLPSVAKQGETDDG